MAQRIFRNADGKTVNLVHVALSPAYLQIAHAAAHQAYTDDPPPVPVPQPFKGALEAVVFSAFFLEVLANWIAVHEIPGAELDDFLRCQGVFRGGRPKGFGLTAWRWTHLFRRRAPDFAAQELLAEINEVMRARNELAHFNPETSSSRVIYERDIVNESLKSTGAFYFASLETEPRRMDWGGR